MIEYNGLSIKTNEKVYPVLEDSFLAAEMIADYLRLSSSKDLDVLDMGTASGILGLSAAMSPKVASVILVDIDGDAIALARENFKANEGLISAGCHFIQSDLFSKVKGKFDLIIFNAPYLRASSEEPNEKDLVGGESGVELSIRFIDLAIQHMKEGARIVLIASSLSNFEMLSRHIQEKGLMIMETRKVHIFFEDIIALLIGNSHADQIPDPSF